MISRNLRHLRVFLTVAELGSLTQTSARCHLSQPAITQAIASLERQAGGQLFDRSRKGFFVNARGAAFEARLRRMLARLDAALGDVSMRLVATATTAQLESLIAVCEVENFTLAARQLNVSQPTVHRAIAHLEHSAGRPLFQRTAYGLVPTRPARSLAQAARLAFSELAQAEDDLAEFDGDAAGRIVIGSLPLARSVLLPEALAALRSERDGVNITVIDGLYNDLLTGLRRGEIDMIVGALRDPAPIADVDQRRLFDDHLAIVARPGHPLVKRKGLDAKALGAVGWMVPRGGTPARAQFDAFFSRDGVAPPQSLIECGSILLMRETLARTDMLGCISGLQARAEIANGLLARLDVDWPWPGRAIGVTTRSEWVPTAAQQRMVDILSEIARGFVD